MTKAILFFIVSLLSISNSICPQSQENTPQKVYRYCYVIKTQEWYKKQVALWGIELAKNADNENGWYNYYFANRYAGKNLEGSERQALLQNIIEKMGAAIPNSYLYPYLKYYNGERKIEYLEQAYRLKPNAADLYWEFIQYYETEGNKEKKKEFCDKLYNSKEIIPSLYNYSFNVLNSLKKNAILFTNGDNDTYPLWILQETKGLRKDVLVLNAHALYVLRNYMQMKLKKHGVDIDYASLPDENEPLANFMKELIGEIRYKYPTQPIYFVPTMDFETVKEVVDNLYNSGLSFVYSEKLVENISLISNNVENMSLEYLENNNDENHVSKGIVDEFNLNYIPAFMELSKKHNTKGTKEKSDYWKNQAIKLAVKANDKNLIKKIEEGTY